MSKKVTMIVAGAGDRGMSHAGYALQHPDEAQVVGVAEPRDYQRTQLAKAHGGLPRRTCLPTGARWRRTSVSPIRC